MSLINRIEISNFVCLLGPEAADSEWAPLFRHNILDLGAQSSAISMPNGTGKTSMSEGVIAILSRDRVLAQRTREKMAPASFGSYSHIRVELLIPKSSKSQDMFVSNGYSVPGEIWVFGVCGFRGKQNSLSYYYYKGRLEDCPVVKTEGLRKTFVSNADFKECRKNISGFHFNVDKDDWSQEMSNHDFRPHTLHQMATFQKKGGGDTSSSIYNITPRRNEKYHEAFFYSIIAPELLSGAMSDEDDEGDEFYLEETFRKSGQKYIRAKHETARREKKLKQEEGALEALESIAKKSNQALTSELEMKQLFSKISEEASVINSLIKQRFIGIPFVDQYPSGKAGELAQGIVVIPQFGVAIQDAVLAKLTGKVTDLLNREAMNMGLKGAKIAQPIEIIMDQPIQRQNSIALGDREGRCYSQEQAQKLLKGNNLAVELIGDVFQWFETSVDTNQYRKDVVACEREISDLLDQISQCEKNGTTLKESREDLESTIKKIDSYRDAWKTLNSKGCFTPEELNDLERTSHIVSEEHEEVSQATNTHKVTINKLTSLQAAYSLIQEKFGTDADPASVLAENSEKIKECIKRRSVTDGETSTCKVELGGLEIEVARVDKKLVNCSKQAERLESLSEQAKEFQSIFGDVASVGLEQKVVDEKDQLNDRLSKLPLLMEPHREAVGALKKFRKKLSECSPSEWVKNATEQYPVLLNNQNVAQQEKDDLERKFNELNDEKVAATAISSMAIETLRSSGLSFNLLHEVVQGGLIEPDRKKVILSHFSALLFAPVFDDQDQAEIAARIFHKGDHPVPVFLRHELYEFIKHGELQSGVTGLVFNHQAGVCTRTVDCIIDPKLIEKEKEKVQLELDQTILSLTAISEQIVGIHPDSEMVSLAKKAASSLDSHSENILSDLQAEYDELKPRSEEVNSRASYQTIKLIKSMIEFNEAGGHNRLAALSREKSGLSSQLSDLNTQLNNAHVKRRELELALEQCDAKLGRLMLSSDITIALSKAADFLAEGGPDYMEKADALSQELKEKLNLANERNAGEYIFSNAAKFLESKETDFSQLEEEIQNISDLEKKLLSEISEHDVTIEQVKINRNRLAVLEALLDDAIAAFLEEYKHLRACLDMLSAQENATQPNSEIVLLASQYMNERGMSEKSDIELLERLINSFNQMQIKHNAGEARKSRDKFNAEMESLSSFVSDSASTEVISINMRTALKMNAGKPMELIALRDQFSIDYGKAKELFEKAQKAEKEVRAKAVERLVTFCDDARDNLRQMKHVLKGTEATLEIKAKVSDEDSLIVVVDSIMSLIEEEEKHFNKTKENIEGEEEKYKQTLTDKIKSRIYRGIFHDTEVKVIHPNIRQGRPFPLSTTLSGGQRTAVSLMVMAKLAEYSMRIDSIRDATNAAGRKRAISRSSSVLIIDGLFSNLSKPSLIRNSLSSLKASRGNFQLIGLIHWPEYVNNPEIFPTYIIGKEVADPNDPNGISGFVYTENGKDIIHPNKVGRNPGELDSATFHVSH